MIRIGLVGIGFMGMIHYLASLKLKEGKVVALCSRDRKKLDGDWRGIQGNFGPPGELMNTSKLAKYENLDDLLADPTIDLVDICNPTHLHPDTAIKALQAGKHVLVEKAIALESRDADAMLNAAAKAGKLLMVAHVLPFFPEFNWAYTAIQSGKYGKLLGAHFKRIISKPDWSVDIGDAAKTGGPAVDLHIHDTHFIGLIAGVPKKVFSTGIVGAGGAVDYLCTSYLYDKGPAITCASGAVAMKARPFVHGYEIHLEKATLTYESGSQPLTVFDAKGKSKQPKLKGGDSATAAFTMELQAAVNAIANKQLPPLLSGQLARDALVLCHKECQSVVTGSVQVV